MLNIFQHSTKAQVMFLLSMNTSFDARLTPMCYQTATKNVQSQITIWFKYHRGGEGRTGVVNAPTPLSIPHKEKKGAPYKGIPP